MPVFLASQIQQPEPQPGAGTQRSAAEAAALPWYGSCNTPLLSPVACWVIALGAYACCQLHNFWFGNLFAVPALVKGRVLQRVNGVAPAPAPRFAQDAATNIAAHGMPGNGNTQETFCACFHAKLAAPTHRACSDNETCLVALCRAEAQAIQHRVQQQPGNHHSSDDSLIGRARRAGRRWDRWGWRSAGGQQDHPFGRFRCGFWLWCWRSSLGNHSGGGAGRLGFWGGGRLR